MTVDTPTARGRSRRFSPARFVVRVGSEWSHIRAATICPIAEVLDAGAGLTDSTACPEAAELLVLDLIDSGMIAPPRPRRRRERSVSSRAVYYQSDDA